MIDHYAVFGDPIKHSKSPRIHTLFAQQTQQDLDYVAQQVPAETFVTATKVFFANGGQGLNCTVPLKELAWQYADQLTERARLAKAVNTLAKQADGSILGDNTDGIGLVNDLIRNHQIQLAGKRILILGAGGATRGIILPLLDCQPAQISIANRTVSKAEALVADFAAQGRLTALGFEALEGLQFDVVLNATSASLSDQLPPLPADLLAANACCYDLAYGNLPTTFVRWGLAQGAAQSLDGLGMLVEQAAEAFFIWRGVRPATTDVIALLDAERQK
ncbi:MAG: shikimate dehydrogenase [Methylomonas sp.]